MFPGNEWKSDEMVENWLKARGRRKNEAREHSTLNPPLQHGIRTLNVKKEPETFVFDTRWPLRMLKL